MKKLIFAALAVSFPAAGYCGGSSFGEIVTVAPSVRANAMGDAYTAADGDTFGFFYNPAQTAPKSVAAAYQRGYSDNDGTGIFAASLPGVLPAGLNLGLGFAYYNSGSLEMYTDGGSPVTFSAENDWLMQANVSRQVAENISVGATAKLAHLSLFDAASGSALLWDAGVLAKYPFANIGFALQNFGQRLKLGDVEETFPSSWRAGAYRGFDLAGNAVNIGLDYAKYRNETPYVRLGGEFVCKKIIAFRLGYEFKNTLATANTLLYGIGLTLRSWNFDYALVPFQTLGATHRLSLTYKFETADRKAEPAPAAEVKVMPAAPPAVSTVSVPVDADADGVPDSLDKCPGTPAGVVVDSSGCPVDTDKDGVPDYLDKCPGTSTGTVVDAAGCPVVSTAELQALDRLTLLAVPGSVTQDLVDAVRDAAGDPACPWEQVDKFCMKLAMEFDYDKAALKGNFSGQLSDIGEFMKANPGARIELLGCTDDHGTDDYNITLSGARAEAVMKHLVDVEGLEAGRLSAKGIGKGRPVADNQSEEGRQRNRRVIAVLSVEKAQ